MKRVRCDPARLLELVRAGLTNDQLATEVGVTTRTLDRWRSARPDLTAAINEVRAERAAAALLGCGTAAAYRRGCRCLPCRVAARESHQVRRRRAQSRPIPESAVHGRVPTYNWYACRCDPCVAANSAASADYKRRRVAS